MRWLACALAVALPLAAAAEAPGIRVLGGAHARGREAVLVDALRIYMRDLGRPVRVGGPAPPTLETVTLSQLAAEARAQGDDVVVWFGERAGAPVLFALRVPTLELRETPVEPDEPDRTARTLALKVRALVAARADDANWSVPPESPSQPPSATTPPTTIEKSPEAELPETPPEPPKPETPAKPPEPAPSSSPSIAEARSATVTAKAPARPRRIWLEAEVTYGAIVPTTVDWVRHGLTVRLAAPFGKLPLAAFADAAFTTEPTATVDGTPVSARVWPIGVGLAYRLQRRSWQLSAGPRASLQIVDANALAADGRNGAARRYGAGVGAIVEAAWRFHPYLAAVASVGGEALIPRLQFAAGGPSQTDLGWAQFSFNLGLIVSIP